MSLYCNEIPNGLHLRMDAVPDVVPVLLDRLEAFAEEAALPSRVANHLLLIAEELVVNVITHGKTATFITMALCKREGALHIQLEDDGPAFDPLSSTPPHVDEPLETRAIGGVGIQLIRKIAEMRYERVGCCNRLDLILVNPSPVP